MQCQNCIEITRGVSLAVAEIDGASHNSVDNVRSLIETLRTSPPPESAYKIYIIDEVHMLSTAAFNALLKSIEEPPEKVIFMLATTELHKIPDTVVSRCMVFEFRALDIEVIESRLRDICSEEEITYEEEALAVIARLAEGSMRDAETLLDRLRRFSVETLTEDDAAEVFGAVQKKALYQISYAVIHKNPTNILYVIDKVFKGGCDPMNFLKSIVTLFRELLVLKLGDGAIGARFGIRCEDEEIMRNQLASINAQELQEIVQGIRKDADNACRSNYLRYALEASLVRYAMRRTDPEGGKRAETGNRQNSKSNGSDKHMKQESDGDVSKSLQEHPIVKTVLEKFPGSTLVTETKASQRKTQAG